VAGTLPMLRLQGAVAIRPRLIGTRNRTMHIRRATAPPPSSCVSENRAGSGLNRER